MNQIKIGKFIAACRKKAGMTQSQLAEKFNISDRAVSKWETGKSIPDSSIMLELCEILGITVNELLKGEKVFMEDYAKVAEANLLKLKKLEENRSKMLLQMEIIIGIISTASFILLIFVAMAALDSIKYQAGLIITAVILFLTGIFSCLFIEQNAGYYKCKNCGHVYVPTIKSVIFARHLGRSRCMICPECGQKGYAKKVIHKE